MKKSIRTLSLVALSLCVGVLHTPASYAQTHLHSHDPRVDAVVIQRTIPYPQAVNRVPLTSDRLNTTSTRFIDARRGFRPFDTVVAPGSRFGCVHQPGPRYVYGVDDHFGISRPENRPISYALRTPRTGVTQHVNTTRRQLDIPSYAPRVIDLTEQSIAPTAPNNQTTAPSRVRIHRDTSAKPSGSGAVLITSDGRVIQVGN